MMEKCSYRHKTFLKVFDLLLIISKKVYAEGEICVNTMTSGLKIKCHKIHPTN